MRDKIHGKSADKAVEKVLDDPKTEQHRPLNNSLPPCGANEFSDSCLIIIIDIYRLFGEDSGPW